MSKSLDIWRYGYFDSKQNDAADRGIGGDGVVFFSIERNTIAIESQSFAAGITAICLAYGRDWQGVIGPLIHGESKSQATGSSSGHVGLLHTCQQSTLLESKLRACLVLEILAKLMVRENLSWEFPNVRVHLILEVPLTLETRWQYQYWWNTWPIRGQETAEI